MNIFFTLAIFIANIIGDVYLMKHAEVKHEL